MTPEHSARRRSDAFDDPDFGHRHARQEQLVAGAWQKTPWAGDNPRLSLRI